MPKDYAVIYTKDSGPIPLTLRRSTNGALYGVVPPNSGLPEISCTAPHTVKLSNGTLISATRESLSGNGWTAYHVRETGSSTTSTIAWSGRRTLQLDISGRCDDPRTAIEKALFNYKARIEAHCNTFHWVRRSNGSFKPWIGSSGFYKNKMHYQYFMYRPEEGDAFECHPIPLRRH